MNRAWDAFLTERDKKVIELTGYGARGGLADRPVLLIVDITYGFVGDRPEPILDSVVRYRNSCGAEGWHAIERLQPVLTAARRKNVPVIYTTPDSDHRMLDLHSWGRKNSRYTEKRLQEEVPADGIPTPIAPLEDEVVIRKKKPSAFFGTPLSQYLVSLGVNQVLCCGVSTSGCIRATVVDAFSYGYHVAVIEDCTFDRIQASHAINLFDLDQKYAEIISSEEALHYISRIPDSIYPEWRV